MSVLWNKLLYILIMLPLTSVICAFEKSDPTISVNAKLAPVKSAPLKLEFTMSAKLKSALVKSALEKSVFDIEFARKFSPLKF